MSDEDRRAVSEYAKAAALGGGVALLLLLFFSPSWVAFRAWVRVPEAFSGGIPVRRGAYVAMQVADPSIDIPDRVHWIIRWRLLIPMIGHVLGMPPGMVLALSYVGCVVVLAVIVGVARRRGAAWSESAMLAVVAGAAAWFFTSTGWLGYYDSWLVLGFLTVAWIRSRWLLWLACVLTPWVDERFVLGFPLAILVRWIATPGAPPAKGLPRGLVGDVAVATVLVAGYVGLRLWLGGQAGSPTVGDYWRGGGVDPLQPLARYLFGGWEGLRAGWIAVGMAVVLLLRRRRVLAGALLAIGVLGTTLAGFATANDLSRAVAPALPAVPLGWELARTEVWWTRWHAPRVLAATALLLPAHHVVTTFTVPIEQLWHELRALADPPPPFAAEGYLQEAQRAATQGDLDRAETLASVAVRLEPTALGRNVRGVILARRDRWAEALREFDAAVALDPSMAEALLNRAKAHVAESDWAAARRDAVRARELAPPESAMAQQATELLRALDRGR